MSQEPIDADIEVLREELQEAAALLGWAGVAKQVGLREDTLAKFATGKNRKPRAGTRAALLRWQGQRLVQATSGARLADSPPVSADDRIGDASPEMRAVLRLIESADVSRALWAQASAISRSMREALQEAESDDVACSTMLAAYRELARRTELINSLAHELARNSPSPEAISRLTAIGSLNESVFSLGLLDEDVRPRLLRSDPASWPAMLGVEIPDGLQMAADLSTGGIICRDRSRRVVCFFDERLLSES